MADTTTTTSWPALRVSTIRFATRLMPSASATDEPPYFCTTRPTTDLLGVRRQRAQPSLRMPPAVSPRRPDAMDRRARSSYSRRHARPPGARCRRSGVSDAERDQRDCGPCRDAAVERATVQRLVRPPARPRRCAARAATSWPTCCADLRDEPGRRRAPAAGPQGVADSPLGSGARLTAATAEPADAAALGGTGVRLSRAIAVRTSGQRRGHRSRAPRPSPARTVRAHTDLDSSDGTQVDGDRSPPEVVRPTASK